MDYFSEIARRLSLPPEQQDEVLRELRTHYDELKSELASSGLSEGEAGREAERRLGDPVEVASRLRALHQEKPLFPPRDFIPTAFMWGFWAAGVLAGVNYLRLGYAARGRRLILLSVASFLALVIVIDLAMRRLLHVAGGGAWLCIVPLAQVIVNCAVGYRLCESQSALYRGWAERNPSAAVRRASPYVAWWVSVLAILGATVLIVSVGALVYQHSAFHGRP